MYIYIIRIPWPYLRINMVCSTFPISKPLSNRNPLNLTYHALGACFNPYNTFLNLYTQWGYFSLSNPGG
jgi:hypothetical protein